ncbi:hypothetical protein [Patulibacter sp. SYSU D01012]|uniref:hypothetical protein n=1 Tax=Patulibacter sp. SYSU D01012 TaxID=2817381 RepID=UPI001B30B88E|nr:hypothetical protein [Patulibacter sp. SYSU D01012]
MISTLWSKWRVLTGATAALAVTLAIPVAVFAGGLGFNRVTAVDVYVRASPQGLYMGRLYKGEHFNAQYISPGGWGWGYAYGGVNRCVWVDMSYMVTAPDDPHATPPDCGPHRFL